MEISNHNNHLAPKKTNVNFLSSDFGVTIVELNKKYIYILHALLPDEANTCTPHWHNSYDSL